MLIIHVPSLFASLFFHLFLSKENCMATNQKCTTTSAEQSKKYGPGAIDFFSVRFSALAEERVERLREIIIWNYVVH